MFKKNILTGLLVLIPIVLTLWVLVTLTQFLDQVLLFLPKEVQPDVFFGGAIPGYGVIVTLIVVFLTGVISNNFFGKKHTKKTKLQISKTKTGQKYSEEFCKRRSELTSGKNNPRFNNWSSKGKYDEKWDDKIKLKIKNRDNYECKNCNIYTKTGHVHHIDWNKKNTIEKNLIYLCVRCHNKSHAPTKKTNYIQKYKRMVIFK